MHFKTVLFTICVILYTVSAATELMGPYQCPSDSRCQDINSCTSAYKKKTASGKLFYCGPQNRMEYMVCCTEKELNWDQPTGDEMENEILAMLMPNNNASSTASSKFEFDQNRTKSNGPTSIITNILSTDNMVGHSHSPGHELDEIFGEQEKENVDSENSVYSNQANIYTNQDSVQQSPIGPSPTVNPPDLKRDSRKSFIECNCERGPPGPPGPPGQNGKVIYVPILISSSTPLLSMPTDVAASVIPYMQQMIPQSQNPLYDSVPQPPPTQNTQQRQAGQTNHPTYYSHKAPSYPTNANPSLSLQNKIKRHSHI